MDDMKRSASTSRQDSPAYRYDLASTATLAVAQSYMACSSPPPAKRARRSCRTFEMSPAVAQAPPVYTNLIDARPGTYYNLRCRVSSVSLGEQAGRAQGTLGARGHEHSCTHEDDCTWHKRLCGCQRGPVLVDSTAA
eukprot:4338560-Amphidinium_carterae.1